MTIGNIRFVIPALMVIVLLSSCATSRPSPEVVINRAISAVEEVQTYRIDWTTSSSGGEETTQLSMLIEFVAPNRLHVLPRNYSDAFESIIVGQTQYYREADGAEWQVQHMPESPVADYSPASSMAQGLASLVDVMEMPDEEIDGVACFHYRGSVDTEAVVDEQIAELDPSDPSYEAQKMTLEQMRQSTADWEFWIGKSDYLLRQLHQDQKRVLQHGAGEDAQDEKVTVEFTYRFYDFNMSIDIEPPPDENVMTGR